ncbi:MAG TPA: hypothetical protein ENK91_09470, partial [Bacteroidetes bacterium]|nr:hypothetical protein [Bacteroidota bacterium]
PQLKLPKEKEINFFDIYYKEGKSWYKSQFPFDLSNDKVTGDFTPYYLYHPLSSKRAVSFNPDFKIIILLRNPVNRAISHYNMIKNRYSFDPFYERLTYFKQEILAQEAIEKKLLKYRFTYSEIHRHCSYLRRGIYLYQIKHWQQYFPKENFLIIKSEEFYNNPQKVLNKICDHLGINHFYNYDLNVNRFKGDYKEEINPEIVKKLKEFYEPYNIELENYLNMKFNW